MSVFFFHTSVIMKKRQVRQVLAKSTMAHIRRFDDMTNRSDLTQVSIKLQSVCVTDMNDAYDKPVR